MNFSAYKINVNSFVVFCCCLLFFTNSLFAATLYVDTSTDVSTDMEGNIFYSSIQPALDAASAGDTILVKAGTYTGPTNTNLDFKGKDLILRSEEGAEKTILDCENRNNCRGFHFHSGETNAAVVDGFTITGGNRNQGSDLQKAGGAIFISSNSSPTIQNNIIRNNFSECHGGAIYNENGGNHSPRIIKNQIHNNRTACSGGAIYNGGEPFVSRAFIEGNQIYENEAAQLGGGIFNNDDSSPTIVNNKIYKNIATQRGGGIYNDVNTSSQIINNIISRNQAVTSHGGGMYNMKTSDITAIVHNTILNNHAHELGGGIFNNHSSPEIINTIVWGNTSKSNDIYNHDGSSPSVSYSIVQEGYEGEGNIDQDPLIYGNRGRLLSISPAIDAGKKVDVSTDINDRARPYDGKIGVGDDATSDNYDIGAYEYRNLPLTPITETYYVDKEIPESTGNTFITIQEALDAAYEKWENYEQVQTILVKRGRYTGDGNTNLDFKGMNLTLRSEEGAEKTTIDCEKRNNCRGFHFHSGETNEAVVDGFTITNSSSSNAIYNDSSSPTIINNNISNNTSPGISNNSSSPIIINNNISNNYNGIENYNSSSPTIINNNISDSVANGIQNSSSSSPTIINNNISNGGDGIRNHSSSPTIINNNILNNRDNGIQNSSSSPTITNTIIWGNNKGVVNYVSSNPFITYSIVQGGYEGEGNIDQDPLFYKNSARLLENSPAIDAGKQVDVSTDIEGNPRGIDGKLGIGDETGNYDIGAYEYTRPMILIKEAYVVDKNLTESTETEFVTIQEALDKAYQKWWEEYEQVQTILVKSGTYIEDGNTNLDFKGMNLTLRSEEGAENTTIDCQNREGCRGFYFHSGETNEAIVDGFTITGGNVEKGGGIYIYQSSPTITNVTISNNAASHDGGGIYIYQSSPMITNVTISNNTADYGGGIYNSISSPTIMNTIISENTARGSIYKRRFFIKILVGGGGGIYNSSSSPKITNVTISNNTTKANGGGIYNFSSSPIITNVTISNNTASYDGGGIANSSSSSPIIKNTIISNNQVTDQGGGVFNSHSSPKIQNSTIWGNHAVVGGGIYNSSSSSTIITNTIVWGNQASTGPQIYIRTQTASITYTVGDIARHVDASYSGGEGNFNQDPKFVDPDNGDFRLQSSSPAIDAGQNIPGLYSDIRGSIRPFSTGKGDPYANNAFDIGAYEYSGWSNGEEDQVRKLIQDITLNAKNVYAETYEYPIQFKKTDLFPANDIRHDVDFEVNIFLVNPDGITGKKLIDTKKLDTQMSTEGYEHLYKFRDEDLGEKRIRIEIKGDPHQFNLSNKFTVHPKIFQQVIIGEEVLPPNLPGVEIDLDKAPDFSVSKNDFFWDEDQKKLYAKGITKDTPIIWKDQEDQIIPYSVTNIWPKELFKGVDVGGKTVYTGYEYLLNWHKFSLFPGEEIAQFRPEIEVVVSFVKGFKDDVSTDTFEKEISLGEYTISAYEPEDGYFIRYTFDDPFFELGEKLGHGWQLKVTWKENPNHYGLSPVFQVENPNVRTVNVGEIIQPIHNNPVDPINIARKPTLQENPSAFSWNYATQELKAVGVTKDTKIEWYTQSGQIISEQINIEWPHELFKDVKVESNILYTNLEQTLHWRSMQEFPGIDSRIASQYDVVLYLVKEGHEDLIYTHQESTDKIELTKLSLNAQMPAFGYKTSFVFDEIHQSKTETTTWKWKLGIQLQGLEVGGDSSGSQVFYGLSKESFSIEKTSSTPVFIGDAVTPPLNASSQKPKFDESLFYYDEIGNKLYPITPKPQSSIAWFDMYGNEIPQVITSLFPLEQNLQTFVIGSPEVDFSLASLKAEVKYQRDTEVSLSQEKYFSMSSPGYAILVYKNASSNEFERVQAIRGISWKENLIQESQEIGRQVNIANLKHDTSCGSPYVYFQQAAIAINTRIEKPYNGYHFKNREGPIVPTQLDNNPSEENDLVVITYEKINQICWPSQAILYEPSFPQNPQMYVAGSAPVNLMSYQTGTAQDSLLFSDLIYSTKDTANLDSLFQYTAVGEGYSIVSFGIEKQDGKKETQFEVIHNIAWHVQVQGKTDQLAFIGEEIIASEDHEETCGGGYLYNIDAPHAMNTQEAMPYSGYDQKTRTGPIVPINLDPSPLSHNDFVVVWYEKSKGICWPAKTIRYLPRWPENPQTYVAGSDNVVIPESLYSFAEIKYKEPWNDAQIGAGQEFVSTRTGRSVLAYGENKGDKTYFKVIQSIDWKQEWEKLQAGESSYLTEKEVDIGEIITDVRHADACSGGDIYNELSVHAENTLTQEPFNGYDADTKKGPIAAMNLDYDGSLDLDNDLIVTWYNQVDQICWGSMPVRYIPKWSKTAESLIIASGQGSGYLSPLQYKNAEVYVQEDSKKSGFNPNEEHGRILSDVLYSTREDLNQEGISKPYSILRYQNPNEGNRWEFKTYKVVQEEAPYFFNYDVKAGSLIQPPMPLASMQACQESSFDLKQTPDYAWYKDYNHNLWAKSGVLDPASNNPSYSSTPTLKALFYERWDGECHPWPYQKDASGDLVQDEQGNPIQRTLSYNIYWPDDPHWNTHPRPILSRGSFVYLKSELPENVLNNLLSLQDQYFENQADFESNVERTIGSTAFSKPEIKASILQQMPKPLGISEVPQMMVGETLLHPKYGLPEIDRQCSVEIITDQSNLRDPSEDTHSVKLVDILSTRYVELPDEFEFPSEIKTQNEKGKQLLIDLPYHLRSRLLHDPISRRLEFKGILDESTAGEPLLLLNVISEKEEAEIKALHPNQDYKDQVTKLATLTRDLLHKTRSTIAENYLKDFLSAEKQEEFFKGEKIVGGQKALTSGSAKGVGYVTLAMQADISCSPLPLSLNVIKIKPQLFTGEIKPIYSLDPFEEIVTLRHNGDFGGVPKDKEFEWRYLPPENGGAPEYQEDGENTNWTQFEPPNNNPLGVVGVDIFGPGVWSLEDKYFIVRYRGFDVNDQVTKQTWSKWTRPQLYEGWIKRALRGIAPYEQRVKTFHASATDTTESMIMQAGKRYEGDIALNATPENINNVGLIEAYQTILNRGKRLSIDSSLSTPTVNDALLLAAGRIADLYMLLGNEAFADALDPTIGFGTDQGQYGAQATSLFSFQNQMSSLLEEELALLRGRDIQNNNPVQIRPFYNRLIWNFTSGIDGGEVAYNLNYNLKDQNQDGFINSEDAMKMYPQGHGDAWGHYLTAIKSYYDLLGHDQYDWMARSESVLVAGVSIRVDYYDERKFAQSAASRIRVGKEIVKRTYLQTYSENHQETSKSYQDSQVDNARYDGESKESKKRAWSMNEWATRAGQGGYLDWIVANRLLPQKDTVNKGIAKVDRSTVSEIQEISSYVTEIQHLMDQAGTGMNPLGIASNAILFDIDPKAIEQGQTHFEQVYQRAENALQNATVLFDHSNQNSQLIRRQQDALSKFQQNIKEREESYKSQLISIFGYPYANDIGPGGTYLDGYDGPDLYHYMYVDVSELMGVDLPSTQMFKVQVRESMDVNTQGEIQEKIREVDFHVSNHGFGLIKPENWNSRRRAPGEIQIARSNLLQALARFQKGMKEYDNLISNIEAQASLLKQQNNVNVEQIQVLNETKNEQMSLNQKIMMSRIEQFALRLSGRRAVLIGNAIAEGSPKVVGIIAGLASGVIADPGSPARAAAKTTASITNNVLNLAADILSFQEMGYQHSKEEVSLLSNIRIQEINQDHQLRQSLSQIEQMIRSKASLRLELLTLKENLEQMQGHYLSSLAKGQRLLEERIRFRKNTAVDVQAHRYKDMAFRIFRNEALQGYEDQFNLAAKYVYLAAKAYDYETNLLSDHPTGGKKFLDSIVKQRRIGRMSSTGSMKGEGLADSMYQMKTNFQMMKGQLGFNNPQTETNRFSLRKELFRIKEDYESNPVFQRKLESLQVDNLWEIPEFKRYARPFNAEKMEPGLVIEFASNITSEMNFFGWPAGGGDSVYSSSHFATKIRSVGVWFSNYNKLSLLETPRIYLIPVGQDLMRSPSYGQTQIREFRILDQKLPLVFPLENSFGDSFENVTDQLFGNFGEPRKFSTFRAYHDHGFLQESQLNYDSRLIGRSVWNTKWMLIIPGASLNSDAEEGLNTFIYGAKNPITKERNGGISDIKLFFKTYSYSGN